MPITRCGKFIDLPADLLCGDHCVVWSFAVICPGVRLGHRVVIGSHVYIGRETVLGDDVHIQDGCHLTDHMHVGRRVFFGPHVTTSNDRHPRVNNPEYIMAPPIIEDDVSIGSNATILPGVRLGQGCIIGAGAVVTKNVPAGEVWIGNPAFSLTAKRALGTSTLIDDLGIDPELYFRGCCQEAHATHPAHHHNIDGRIVPF